MGVKIAQRSHGAGEVTVAPIQHSTVLAAPGMDAVCMCVCLLKKGLALWLCTHYVAQAGL